MTNHWINDEFGEISLGDRRLVRRFMKTADELAGHPSASINQACGNWADVKGAYRFFGNPKITHEEIFAVHACRTAERMKGEKIVLAVEDSTYINFTAHPSVTGLGHIGTGNQEQTGLIQHATLAVTPAGLPLGLLTQKLWARDMKKRGKAAGRRKRPIEEKESIKWLTAAGEIKRLTPAETRVIIVSDREADIYEYFRKAEGLGTEVLVRAAHDRRVMEESPFLWEFMEQQSLAGTMTVTIPARDKQPEREVKMEIRFSDVRLCPPAYFHGKGETLTASAVLAREKNPPSGIIPVEWMLLANSEISSAEDAILRIRWYRCRWHIENYHKVLKSGCRIEDCRLGTAERLKRFLALMAVIAWRLYWLTHMNRQDPDASCGTVLEEHEWKALYAKINRTPESPAKPPTVREAVRWIAQLGGFLGRKGDGEPGITVIWRGWQRLQDIADTRLIFTDAV
jgi:hypothetical protein